MWVAVVIALAAAWFIYRGRKNTAGTGASGAPVRLAGDGDYAIEVVGESKYPASFEAICGPQSESGVNISTRAVLTLERSNKFDKHAVRVSIQGHTVGYLSRIAAQAFRTAVARVGHGKTQQFECAAVIRGGWDRGPGDRGSYGVWLDIP